MVSPAPLTERSSSRAPGAGAHAAGRPPQNEAARGGSRGPLRTRRSEPVQAAVGISPSCRIQNRQQHPLATRARADGRRPERRATADIDRALFEWIIVDSEMIADRGRTRYPPAPPGEPFLGCRAGGSPGRPGTLHDRFRDPGPGPDRRRAPPRECRPLRLGAAPGSAGAPGASRRPRRVARGEPPPRGGERAPRPAPRGR